MDKWSLFISTDTFKTFLSATLLLCKHDHCLSLIRIKLTDVFSDMGKKKKEKEKRKKKNVSHL